MVETLEVLKYDVKTESQDLDRTLVKSGMLHAHFTSDKEIREKNPKFYNGIVSKEISQRILEWYIDIFNSQLSFLGEVAIDILHTSSEMLHMDVNCCSCIISFDVDPKSGNGVVMHREAYDEAKVVGTWENYPNKEIFLWGKEVFDSYFWED